ncbi:MAG TPA: glucose-6-phosphate dehydrogenase assembly protein OpcA [Candidatus Limnocylindria bacterium]|nr:glucose-6-phosphate dehydrogenase assembly protein OpcA [Candidatus Limnocylindria bacterium]
MSEEQGVAAGVQLASQEAGTSRWQVRVQSISDCVEKLGQIWSAAAQEAEKGRISDDTRQVALGDPHLSGRLNPQGSVRVRMRTSVLTLVVIAPRPEITERALAAVNALHSRHPSRAIVVSPGDFDGPATVDAHIYAECKLSDRSGAEVCTEQILVKTGGELSQHLSRVVTPLLIHDLPVVLWWPDDPAFGTRQFQEIAGICDRLLVDSGAFGDDGSRRLAGLAAVVSDDVSVSDIGWLRMTLWRELLAGLFDHPLLTPELEHIRSVRLDVARPGAIFRLPKAAYLCGWLAAMLGWEVARPLAARTDGGELMEGAWRKGRKEIKVEVRPVQASLGGSPRTAGSLTRLEIETSRARTQVRARITRQQDHLLATADWNGAQVTRRAGRLEPFEETPFIAEALERVAVDPIFARALVRAVRFLSG